MTNNLPTQLFHYSSRPIDKLESDYRGKRRLGFHKPIGLWLSVEDYHGDVTWPAWCEAEDFGLKSLRYRYLIKLKKEANVLLLSSTEHILSFTETYGSDLSKNFRNASVPIYHISWGSVMEKYEGLIIAPYQWDCRLGWNTTWYYGWDCASGCIWNIDAIESCSLDSIREEVKTSQEEGSLMDLLSKDCCQPK